MHGWTIFAHPCFLDQVERLAEAVESARSRHPARYVETADYKVLAAIGYLAFDLIPQDPARKEYRQGGTLGGERKHWFRAKFGGGRFRLFFRYRTDVKVIIYAWVNDEGTLRTYGSRTDAYATFGRMLESGYPPDRWDELLAQAQSDEVLERSEAVARHISDLRAGSDAQASPKDRKPKRKK